MMAFVDDFRETAIPALREAIKVSAFFVALDLIEIEDARNDVAARARKAGSGLLGDDDQNKLAEWIASGVWKAIDGARERVARIEQRAENAAMADPIRYYDGLAQRCANPEAMRWTFAAICPRYRKYLVGEKRNGN